MENRTFTYGLKIRIDILLGNHLIDAIHLDFKKKKIRLVNLKEFIFNPRIKSGNLEKIGGRANFFDNI